MQADCERLESPMTNRHILQVALLVVLRSSIALTLCLAFAASTLAATPFVHPGMDQSGDDLAALKEMVRAGQEPWKTAYDSLKAGIHLDLSIHPVTHISQGGYGANDRGGKHLSATSRMAYDCALVWYIDDDPAYAAKAIEMIHAWSGTVWDFDDNNAKLIAAGSVSYLCKAAEILRHTGANWPEADIEAFKESLLTVFYPLLRYYFPEANGNWDGYIIRGIMTMGIFLDDRDMFDNAVHHFLYGPVNGSIFKYIYPGGQCQESTRDHGHVQMGLGAFANVAQIAHTQGVDLFSTGDNRIATGVEYEAKFLLGESVFCYGPISPRNVGFSDSQLNYLHVVQHYASLGYDLPFSRKAIDFAIKPSPRNILTAVRSSRSRAKDTLAALKPLSIAFPTGALPRASRAAASRVIEVAPGDSIQDALNQAAKSNGCVLAKAGVHKFPSTLRISSGVTLAGEGVETVLWLDPDSRDRDAIVAASPDLHDAVIRDLVIDGASREFNNFNNQSHRSFRNRDHRGGIRLHGDTEGQMRNITLSHVTVKNCTNNGVWITGTSGVRVESCSFEENGGHVVPGPKLQHNLLLSHCDDVEVGDSRLVGSAHGCGVVISRCSQVTLSKCIVARNAHYGALLSESRSVSLEDCLVEGNDETGVMLEFLYRGLSDVSVRTNQIQYNNGYGLAARAVSDLSLRANRLQGNALGDEANVSDRRQIITNRSPQILEEKR